MNFNYKAFVESFENKLKRQKINLFGFDVVNDIVIDKHINNTSLIFKLTIIEEDKELSAQINSHISLPLLENKHAPEPNSMDNSEIEISGFENMEAEEMKKYKLIQNTWLKHCSSLKKSSFQELFDMKEIDMESLYMDGIDLEFSEHLAKKDEIKIKR